MIFKKRSKFGKWLDKHSISQNEISNDSGVNRNSISRLAKDDQNSPSLKNAQKLIKSMKKVDKKVDIDDFWSI